MIRKAIGLATLIGATLALVGCSSISVGQIVEKVHEPRRTYMCSVKPFIMCRDDEDWRFDIVDGEDSGWVYVDEETFNRYDVGDWYGTSTDERTSQ